MVKRIFSALLLIYMGFYSILSPIILYANWSDGATNSSDLYKPNHLARKALLGPTSTIIDQLGFAGSVAAAVNILFPDAIGPDRTSYNAEVSTLTSSGFNYGNENDMRKLYQLRYYRDPYEAKVKLFSLFEDIFSVNQSDTISYLDIKNQQDLLYENTLGNYKTLVKKILFNNGQPGDYAEGKFLDLLDGTNKNSPNENYARELLQLFLMAEYKPGESKELGSIRNYEESDVAALAKILTGLKSDPTTHTVSYDPAKHNTSTGVLFLSGTLSSNPFSTFYNSASGTLDLGTMQTSLMGNNGLTDNAIDYIFAQRSEAISLFLADRLFRFYIHGKPTRNELDIIAANIRSNDFEILPSVKTLLTSDIMFSNTAMNSVSYKNPLELTIGTLKILHQHDPLTLDPRVYDAELLNMLNWKPYFPGSVFGREGFDDNSKWFTAYTENQWISFATKLANTTSSGSYNINNIIQKTISIEKGSVVNTSPLNTYTGGTISIVGTGEILLSGDTSSASGVSLTYSGGTVLFPNFVVQIGSGVLSIDTGSYVPNDNTTSFLTVSSGSFTYSGVTYTSFSGSFPIVHSGNIQRNASIDDIILAMEDNLFGKNKQDFPEPVKAKIRTYATTSTTGALVSFEPLSNLGDTKIRGIIALALASPEFILQTGDTAPPINENTTPSPISSTNNKLVFIELGGGYDWLHGIIQKDQYATYQNLRTNSSGTIAIAPKNLTDLGDFYMNNSLAFSGISGPSLKSLYDSNNLRIFNRVGTFRHSRDHDAAQKQSTSYSSTTAYEDDGVFGHIIKSEGEGSNTISLSGKRPNIFRNGNFINIGPSGAIFTNYAPITNAEKTSQLNLFRDVFATRSYPGTTGGVFKNAAKIDEVATTSVNRGGPNGAGWGNMSNFSFLQSLLASGVGKTFFIQGDGGYDTHSNQLAPSSNFDPNNVPRDLNYNVGRVVANATAFFNSVKATQNITIVIYSEFGRTIRVNGDLGTDHGEGGGMFVISNNPALQSNLPNKIYGDMNLLREKSDWLGVGIDYRSIYGKIFNSLYGLSEYNYFTQKSSLEENIENTTAPKFTLVRNEFRPGYNNNSTRLVVPFNIEDPNFSMDYGSNLEIEYGTGFSNLKKLNQWSIDNYIRKGDGSYLFDVGVLTKNTPYVYKIRAIDNQFRETIFTGSLNIPDIRLASNSTGTIISTTSDTIINALSNRSITGTIPLSGNTAITLANNETGATSNIIARDGVSITLGTGATQVESITSTSGSITWNGGFILGEVISKDFFISSGSVTNTGVHLSSMNIEKIVKVGADTLGIQMNLNKDVVLSVSGMTSSLPYTILQSEDGLAWKSIGTSSANNGILRFPTKTFSYFALVSTTPVIIPPPVVVVTPPSGGGGGGGGGGSVSKDNCPSGDYSSSYYDGICGINPVRQSTGSISETSTGNNNTTVVSHTSGVFGNNAIISAYGFPSGERIPQKVTAELNFIISKITKVLDKKAGLNGAKKTRYYQTVDTYIQNRATKATSDREKRIFEYLHSRLVTTSRGLLIEKNTTPIIPKSSTTIATNTGTINRTSTIAISSLGINLDHTAFLGYDFTQEKRFPRIITQELDMVTKKIIGKIDSKNPTMMNRNIMLKTIINTLDTRIKETNDIKERKIMQYIRNHLYINQQLRNITVQ